MQFTGGKLYVMNKKTGNTAIADYAAPKDPKKAEPVKFKEDDFENVRGVKLRIISEDGVPLESAVVEISDGNGTTQSRIVTPADDGVAIFDNVASGEATVKVRANGLKRTIDSDIEIPSERKSLGFARDIKVAGDVATSKVAPSENAEQKGETAPLSAASGGSYILQTIAGLIFLAVIVAVVWVILKSKGVTAENALKKMGVALPGEQSPETVPAAPRAPAVDPNICEFCGQRKDANGNCGCTLVGGPSPFVAPGPGASSGGPRLIGAGGTYTARIFEITGASATIGREAGNTIALGNDNTVSRHHATITASGGAFTIRDEGSSNGTFVNGAKISAEQKLTSGDEIQVGGTKFRFEN